MIKTQPINASFTKSLKVGDCKKVEAKNGDIFVGKLLFGNTYYSCIMSENSKYPGIWDMNIILPTIDTYGMQKEFKAEASGGTDDAGF